MSVTHRRMTQADLGLVLDWAGPAEALRLAEEERRARKKAKIANKPAPTIAAHWELC